MAPKLLSHAALNLEGQDNGSLEFMKYVCLVCHLGFGFRGQLVIHYFCKAQAM